MHRVAGRIGAAPHMSGLFAARRAAAEAAEAVPRMPEQHGARECQERAFAAFEPAGQLPQIGKPHARLGYAGCRQGWRAHHLERRFDRRHVEREMRPFVDDAEKYELPVGQPFVDVADLTEHGEDAFDRDRRGARLAVVKLDDQVLVAPDRDEHARGIEHALADPVGFASAQSGPLETGMSIVVRRSHRRRLAQRMRGGQAGP